MLDFLFCFDFFFVLVEDVDFSCVFESFVLFCFISRLFCFGGNRQVNYHVNEDEMTMLIIQ